MKYQRRRCTLHILLSTSLIVLVGILGWLTLKYYGQYKLTQVFPSNTRLYRQANQTLQPQQEERILLFGDSHIFQWKYFPRLPNTQLINRGINGETTSQMRLRLTTDVIELKPDIVIIQAGINDLTTIGLFPHLAEHITQLCLENIKTMASRLTERGIKTIVLTIFPPQKPSFLRSFIWNDHIDTALNKVNNELLSLSQTSSLMEVINTKEILLQGGQTTKELYTDTIHLSPRGYALLNQNIADALNHFPKD